MIYRLFLAGSTEIEIYHKHICIVQYPTKTKEKTSGILKTMNL